MNGNTKEIELKDLTIELAKKVVEASNSNPETPNSNLKIVEITTTVMELDDHEEQKEKSILIDGLQRLPLLLPLKLSWDKKATTIVLRLTK